MNPKYQTVLNHVCYPSLTELPEAPDVVVFSIRNPLIPEQVRLAVKRGARAAVIYDSGFAELGEDGAKLQAEIAGLCREAGMAVCGPNCMGILNPPARVTTYKQTVMNTEGLAGNVGIISQSGSVCIALLSDLRRFGISLSVSAGNEAVTRTVDYLEYLIDDPETKVIATFTETVREPERYVAALDRAAAVGKPVVVLKVGRTERTQRAITSHTGGLAGESRVFSEVLRAHRAIEVTDLDEMTEVLAVCQGRRWPRGRGISVITGSGGLAEMILDNATAVDLDLPPLSSEERTEAERVIGRITGDGNPFDAWGNGNYAVNTPHALSVVDESERIDAIVYCADTSNEGHLGHPGRILENVKMLAEAAEKSSKPYYLMASRPGVMNSQQVKALRELGAGPDRRHAARPRRPRPHRPLHDGTEAAAQSGAPRPDPARRPARRQAGPAHGQRIRCQAAPGRVRPAGHARASGRDHRRSEKSRARARLPGRAQGGVGRHRAQDRARPRRRRPRRTKPSSRAHSRSWASASTGSIRGPPMPPSWCRNSSPAASRCLPGSRAIPISACRWRSAWAAPRSRSRATSPCACCRCARATPRR